MLIWEQVLRQHQNQVLATTVAAALGAQAELPDEFELRRQFDQMLAADPAGTGEDPDRLVLLKALGLR